MNVLYGENFYKINGPRYMDLRNFSPSKVFRYICTVYIALVIYSYLYSLYMFWKLHAESEILRYMSWLLYQTREEIAEEVSYMQCIENYLCTYACMCPHTI